MKTLKNLVNTRNGEKALIIAAGSSTKQYKIEIDEYIKKTSPFIIGINNITTLFTPDYHLWTNTNRFRNFGCNIKQESKLLLGCNIPLKLIKEIINERNYFLINYEDMKEEKPLGYINGKILGFYRTAGTLAIMIAYLMGAKQIDVVGMDGHTLNDWQDVKDGIKAHHCYDENYVPFSKEICQKKDMIINGVLSSLNNYGVNFRILTPTVYRGFYQGTILK